METLQPDAGITARRKDTLEVFDSTQQLMFYLLGLNVWPQFHPWLYVHLKAYRLIFRAYFFFLI